MIRKNSRAARGLSFFMQKIKEDSRMKDVANTMQYVFAAMGGALGAVMG